MTFQQFGEQLLAMFAVSPAQVASIMVFAKEHRVLKSMSGNWGKDVSGYPDCMKPVVRLGILACAVEWLKTNQPEAWMIPVIEAELPKKRCLVMNTAAVKRYINTYVTPNY